MIKSQRLTSCTKTKWDEHSISIVNSVEFKSKQKKNLYTYWPINTDLDFEKPWQLLHSLFIKSGLSLGIREMLRILPLKSKESYACYAWECYITITNIFFLSLSLYIYILRCKLVGEMKPKRCADVTTWANEDQRLRGWIKANCKWMVSRKWGKEESEVSSRVFCPLVSMNAV